MEAMKLKKSWGRSGNRFRAGCRESRNKARRIAGRALSVFAIRAARGQYRPRRILYREQGAVRHHIVRRRRSVLLPVFLASAFVHVRPGAVHPDESTAGRVVLGLELPEKPTLLKQFAIHIHPSPPFAGQALPETGSPDTEMLHPLVLTAFFYYSTKK